MLRFTRIVLHFSWNVAIYAFCQAQILCWQAPKTILHPCLGRTFSRLSFWNSSLRNRCEPRWKIEEILNLLKCQLALELKQHWHISQDQHAKDSFFYGRWVWGVYWQKGWGQEADVSPPDRSRDRRRHSSLQIIYILDGERERERGAGISGSSCISYIWSWTGVREYVSSTF